MNKKILTNSLLISVALITVFALMEVTPVMSGTNNCKILPTNKEIEVTYCEQCGQGGTLTGRCQKESEGGCSCADDFCAQWIAEPNETLTCDWSIGIHVCKAVCHDINMMPVCSQVSKFGGAVTYSYNTLLQIDPFPVTQCGFCPVGSPCNSETDCGSHRCINGFCECQIAGGRAENPIDCCYPLIWEYGYCQWPNATTTTTLRTCKATDTSLTYPRGDDPFVYGTCSDSFGAYTEDKCLSSDTLLETYCPSPLGTCAVSNKLCPNDYYCYGGKCTPKTETTLSTTTRPVAITTTIPYVEPYTNCEREGGIGCFSGSTGCSMACRAQGQWGFCELGPANLGYYPGCGFGDCCCFCVGERTVRLGTSATLTSIVVAVIFVAVIIGIMYAILRRTRK